MPQNTVFSGIFHDEGARPPFPFHDEKTSVYIMRRRENPLMGILSPFLSIKRDGTPCEANFSLIFPYSPICGGIHSQMNDFIDGYRFESRKFHQLDVQVINLHDS